MVQSLDDNRWQTAAKQSVAMGSSEKEKVTASSKNLALGCSHARGLWEGDYMGQNGW